VKKWLALAIVAFVGFGIVVAKRDWIVRRVQHAAGTRVVLGFAGPVPRATLDRARELIERRVHAPVRVDGDELVVDLDPDPSTARIVRELEHDLATPVKAELRAIDADSPYMDRLWRLVGRTRDKDRGDVRDDADTPTGRYIKCVDRARYVNEVWAQRHGCHGDRLVGTGIHCNVTGRESIEAFLVGDADLGMTGFGADFVVPADRELLYGRDDDGWRTYYVTRASLPLDASAVADVATSDRSQLRIDLSASGAAAVLQFGASGWLALVIDGEVRGTFAAADVEIVHDIQLPLGGDVVDAIWLAALPARLNVRSKSSF
jgi:hypothetical protein